MQIAFAYDAGDTVSFSHSTGPGGTYDIFTTSDGFEGCCAEMGLPSDDTGTAVIENPKSNTKKTAYHYGVELGYAQNYDSYKPGWAATKADVLQSLIRASEVGFDEWAAQYRLHASDGADIWISEMRTLFDQLDTVANPPTNFECYYCNAGSAKQNFVIWKMSKNGKLKLKKVSNNTSITG